MEKPIFDYNAYNLRKKAEELYAKNSIDISDCSEAEIQKLYHELAVSQIELELQNEELMFSNIVSETNKKKYIDLYDFAPTAYFTLSSDAKILELNLTAAKLLCKERAYLKNSSFGFFVSTETRTTFNEFLEDVFYYKTTQSCEIIIITEDKNPIYVHLLGNLDSDEKYCLLTAVDITERRIAAENLLKSQLLLKSSIESIKINIILSLDRNFCYNYFNEAHSSAMLLAYGSKIELGQNILQYITNEEDRNKLAKNYERVLAGESFSSIHTNGEATKYYYETFYDPIINDKNEVTGITVLAHNITDRIELENKLKVSEGRFYSLFFRAPLGYQSLDVDGKFLEVNQKWLDILDYTYNEVIGKWFGDFLTPAYREGFHQRFQQYKQKGSYSAEYEMIHKNGEIRIIAIEASIGKDENGAFKQTHCIMHDVTDLKTKDKQIFESDRRFKETLENIHLISLQLDLNGNITYCNPYGCKLLGYSRSELIGQNWLTNFIPQNDSSIKELFTKGIKKDEIKKHNINDILLKDKSIRTIDWNNTMLHDINGKIIGTSSIGQDITNSKQAAERLLESEERFEMLFNKAPLGYQSLDYDGNFIEVNQQWLDTLGYNFDEVIGKWFGDFLTPVYQEGFRKRFPLFKQLGLIHSEFEMIHKNGEIHFIAFDGKIGYDEKGDFKQTHCILQDITEKKKAEEQLKESEEKYKELVENSPDAIAIYEEGKLLFVNNELVRLLAAKDKEEVIGKPVLQFIHPESKELVIERMKKVATEGSTLPFIEEKALRLDGVKVDVEIKAIPIKLEGRNAVQLIIRDLTEKIQAEEKLKESKDAYSRLVNIVDEIIYSITFTDENGGTKVNFVSDQIESITGYKPEEFIEDPSLWTSVMHPDEIDLNDKLTNPENKRLVKGIYRIKHKLTGEYVWVDDNPISIYDDKGNIIGQYGTSRDITERKKAEEDLLEAKEKYRALSEATFESIFISEKGICIEQNLTARLMFGYTDEEAIGRYGTEWIIPEDREMVMNNMITGYEAPYEVTALRKDGTTFPCVLLGKMMNYKGKSVRVTSLTDITERKLAENNLKESEHELQSIFNNLQDAYFKADLEGIFTKVSPSAVRMYGYETEDELIGKPAKNLYADAKERDALISKLKEELKIVDYLGTGIRKDGTTYRVSMNIQFNYNEEGQIIGTSGVVRDITDRMMADENLKKSEEKYRNLFNNSEVAMFRTKLDGSEIIEFNNKYLSILNYTKEDIIGMPSGNIWANKSERDKMVEILKVYGNINNLECDLLTKQGVVINCITSINLNKELGILEGSIIDITERKNSEKQLKNINRLYAMLSVTNEAIVQIKEKEELYTEVCRIVIKHGNFKMVWIGEIDEIINKVVPVVTAGYVNGYLDDINIDLNDQIRSGGPTGQTVKTGVHHLAYNIAESNEMQPWHQKALKNGYYTSAAFPIKVNGKVNSVITLYADNTYFFNEDEINLLDLLTKDISNAIEFIELNKVKQKAVIELKESEEKYKTLFESNSDGITIFNVNNSEESVTHILALNENSARMLGYTKEEMLLINPNELEKDITPEKIECRKQEILTRGVSSFETKVKHKDGHEIYVETKAMLINFNNQPALMNIVRDIKDRKQTERQLKESEEKNRLVLETAMDGFWKLDHKGDIIEVNPSYCNMIGYSKEELLTMNVKDVSAIDTEEIVKQRMYNVTIDGNGRFETKHKRKDGSCFDIVVSVQYDKNTKQFASFFHDITNRKEAEKIIKESEKRLSDIVHSMGEWVWEVDEKGVYTYSSAKGSELLGRKIDEIIGKTPFDFMPPDEAKRVAAIFADIVAKRAPIKDLENWNIKKNGEKVCLLTNGGPLFDVDGNFIGYRGVDKDITSRMQLELDLQHSMSITDATFQSIHNGILVVDHEGVVIKTNNKFAELWNIPEELLLLKDDKILLNHILDQLSDPDEFVAKVSELYNDQGSESFDVIEFKDRRTFERISKPLYIQNETKGRVWSFLDITESVNAKESLISKSNILKLTLDKSSELIDVNLDNFNYETITESLIEISGAKYVGFNLFDEDGLDFTTVAFSGVNAKLINVSSYLGFEVINKKWKHDPVRESKIKDNVITKFNSLHELTGKVISTNISKLIEKTFNIGEVFIVKITKNNTSVGDFTLIYKRGETLQNRELLELFANQVGLFIKRKQAVEELIENDRFLKDTQTIAQLGTYTLDINTGVWTSSEILNSIFGIDPDYKKTVEGWVGIIHPDWQKIMNNYFLNEVLGEKKSFDKVYKIINQKNQTEHWVHGIGKLKYDKIGNPLYMLGTIKDITDQKEEETYRELNREVLLILNRSEDIKYSTMRILSTIKTITGFDAVGIRLKEGEDFPYVAQKGFSKDFLLTENSLLKFSKEGEICRDSECNPCYECFCGEVISGKTESANSIYSKGGSCYVNDSNHFLNILPKDNKSFNSRMKCFQEGFSSIALIPIKSKKNIIGLIHLSDRRKDRFTPHIIEILESVASNIGESLMRKYADIEMIKAKEKAEENEQRLLAFINSIPDIVCYKDAKGRWLLANNADLELFGLTDVNYYGKTDIELAPFTHEIFKNAFKDCMESDEKTWGNGQMTNLIETITTPDGEERYFDLVKMPIFKDNGERKALAVIGRDITNLLKTQKELEVSKDKAEESDRLKTAFLHNISHEVRTPMNAIMGFSHLLNETGLKEEEIKYYSSIITQSSNNLLAIINDIISIATLQAGQETVNLSNVDVNDILLLLHEQYNIKAQTKNISLNYVIPGNHLIISSDQTKLIQILSNLINNAIKFTNNGSINYGYTIKDAYIEFYVEDTGIGIPSEMFNDIFQRFSQVETSNAKLYGGSGLGLSISKSYIELLGGKIWLKSELGKGSKFYFTIPYNKIEVDVFEENEPIIEFNTEVDTKKVILIAEDNEINFMLLDILLKNMNLEIIRAVNGLEVVELSRSNSNIDLILMDIKMPELNGFEATKQIRKFRPEVPIIAQTAYNNDFDRNKALECGCTDCIYKPIKKDQLIAKLKEYLLI